MSINSKLRELRLKRPSKKEYAEIRNQILKETNDRGAAILAVTLVEGPLGLAILTRIDNGYSTQAKLLENQGPLASFDAKIIMAQAFDIIGDNTEHNLTVIKHIRNTFAHASIPCTFKTKEIEEACDSLRNIPALENRRHMFVDCCLDLSIAINGYSLDCQIQEIGKIIDKNKKVLTWPKALP